MKLPFLSKKKEDAGFYLALLLTDEKASAVILHEELGKVKIIGQHQEFFHKSLDHVELEELIEVVDKALSGAEQNLPPNIETHQTVFGVKENWVEPETKKITKHHLAQLKKVCDNLDLTPIGFMVTNEAISHLLQEEEGAPLSAIIADIGKTGVTLTLLRGGKKIESVNGPFKEYTPPVTVDMLLRHFTVPVLPAKIILIDGDSSEKLSQQFIAHQWSKGLPFLHVPQITVLPHGFDARAVAFGAAAQMGFELVGAVPDLPKPTVPEHIPADEAEQDAPTDELTAEEHDPEAIHAAPAVVNENFGFVMNKDISETKPLPKDEEDHPKSHETHEPAAHEPSHHAAHSLIINKPPEHTSAHVQKHDEVEDEEDEDYDEEEAEPQEGRKKRALFSGFKLPRFGGMKGMGFASFGKNKKILLPLIIAGVLLIGLVGLSFYYLYNVQTVVELTIKPNMVSQTKKAVFSTTGSSDYSKNVIAANSLTATVTGETSTEATGKKDIGDKAKGTVTVFNNSSDKVTLSSGTEIKSSNGLVFVTDKDITVASSSGDIFSGTKPGTTTVTVVAKEIGTEQNLPSNTKFAIGSNATLAAKNDSAFSGGTKKSVTVVSKNDQIKLQTDLPKSLQGKAKEAIAQKAKSNETVLPYFATNSLEKATYDKKVDEEAKKVTLKASVVFDGMSYQNDSLVDYAKTVLKQEQSSNVNFADNTIKATVKNAKEKGEKEMEATVEMEGGVVPNVDTAEIAKELDGKSYAQAMDAVTSLPQVADAQITFTPSIPFLPQLFPSLPKNIKVVTKSE